MKKLFTFLLALWVIIPIHAQNVVELTNVANYIDFQALSVSDPAMTSAVITSTAPYELANGTILTGFLKSLRMLRRMLLMQRMKLDLR